MNRKIKLGGIINQGFVPRTHLITMPTSNSFLVDRLGLIWDYQIRINTIHTTNTIASRTSANRVIKIK